MNTQSIVPLRQAESMANRQQPGPEMPATFAAHLEGVPIPERRWLVPGWIPDRAVTLIGGDGGVGKSLLMLQLMASAALGRDWLGFDVPKRKAFAMFCEDDEAEVHIRLKAILDGYAAPFQSVDGMAWAARTGQENVLMSFPSQGNDPGKPTRVYHELRRRVLGMGARLVIVDTVADTFGGNENFRSQVRGFVGLLRNLANEIDGAVILTAHPSVAGQQTGTGLSGSTAWNNSVRSRLYLTRPPAKEGEGDPDARLLKRMKSKYAGVGDEIKMTWQNGVLVSDTPAGPLDRAIMENRAGAVFLELLKWHRSTESNVSATKQSRNYAPNTFAKHPDRQGVSKAAFEAAMHRLLRDKRIVVETYGRPSDPKARLVEVPQ
jgi:RecA-family ATPase